MWQIRSHKWTTGVWPLSGLRARLLVIILMIIIPTFGLITYTLVEERERASAEARREVLNLTRRIAGEERQVIAHTRVLLLSLARVPEIWDSDRADACHSLLASLLKLYPYYINLSTARPDGQVFCSALPLHTPINVADRAYFRRAVETGDFAGGEYLIGRIAGRDTVTFAYPVIAEDVGLRAVVFASLDLGWVSQRLAQAQLPKNSVVTVADTQGTVLARDPDPEKWIGQSAARTPLFQTVITQGEGVVEMTGLDGVLRLYAFAPFYHVPPARAFIWVGIPRAAVYAPVYALVQAGFIRDLSIMILAGLLTLVAAWVGSDRLVLRPIQAIAEAARRLRQADFSARTGLLAFRGELGDLARLFDAMAEDLPIRDRRIAQTAQQLMHTNRLLRMLSEGTQALLRATDEPSLLQDICRIAVVEGGYRLAWVGYVEQDTQKTLRPIAWAGAEPGSLDHLHFPWADTDGGRDPMGTALRTGQPVMVQDIATDPSAPSWREEALASGYASAIALPLRVEGEVLGALIIYAEVPEAFAAEDIRLLRELTADLTLGITHLRLRRAQQQAQEALREGEERTRLLLESMGEGLFAIDRHGLCTQVNPVGLRILGYRGVSELLGRPIHDLIHHTRADGSPCSIEECPIAQALRENREVHSEDEVFWRADGTPFAVEYHSHPILHSGQVVGTVVTFSDITARKHNERTLRELEEGYRTFFELAAAGHAEVDPPTGHFLRVNRRLCEITGYTAEELLGRSFSDITHPEDRERDWVAFQRCAQEGTEYAIEKRYLRQDGQVIWVQVNIAFRRDAEGQTLYAIGVIQDITARKHAEEALQASEERFRATFEQAAVGIAHVALNGQWLRVNQRLSEVTGYSHKELLTKTFQEITHPDDLKTDLENRHRLLAGEINTYTTEKRYLRKDGSIGWVSLTVSLLRDSTTGKARYFISVVEDIAARKQAEEALRESEERTRLVLDSMGEGLFAMDRHGLCTLINPTGLRLLGYRHASELLGRNIHYLIHHTHADGSPYPMEQCPIVQTLQDNQEVHLEDDVFWRADATSFAVEYHSHPILRNGRAVGAVVTFSDITERKAYQIRIAYLATHDALTELPNRTLFNDRTSYTLAAAHRTEQRVAVLFLDLDRFKVINDSLGHTVGDAVLRALSLRLKALMREGDTVARLGGDEFGILLVDIRRVEDVISIVRKLLDAFSKPLAVEGYELFVTVSIGASLYPDDGQDVDTLMTNADVALFRVKEQGRNAFQFYTQDMSLRAQQRLELETALRLALQRQEFELHYQPRVDLRNGTVSGVEALIRWQSRDRGWVPPNSIISIAEESGLILPLGEWVLRTACIQNKRWQEAGLSPMQVAVNVSARQFWQGDICDTVERVLKETGLNARDLELEVTESVIMRDVPEITQTLSHLKSSGLTISIDDFGTGYSSLSYLRRLPVDKLKIDQSFVHDIMSSPEAAGIVRELISLAHALHLSVTAEGVETEEEFGFLSSYGCDEVQGYYISHPLPPAGVQQLLQEANV